MGGGCDGSAKHKTREQTARASEGEHVHCDRSAALNCWKPRRRRRFTTRGRHTARNNLQKVWTLKWKGTDVFKIPEKVELNVYDA